MGLGGAGPSGLAELVIDVMSRYWCAVFYSTAVSHKLRVGTKKWVATQLEVGQPDAHRKDHQFWCWSEFSVCAVVGSHGHSEIVVLGLPRFKRL